MWFLDEIVELLNDATDLFYAIYLEVYSWVYPFWLAAGYFYSLATLFSNLAWRFYSFNLWVDDVASKVALILSYANIYSYFKSYFDAAVNAWSWVTNAWNNVTSIVNGWWTGISLIVQGWIDSAILGVATLIDDLTTVVGVLQAAWENFQSKIPGIDEVLSWFSNWWSNTLANIIAWGALQATQIASLIDSAFILREQFWEGWQDIKDQVFEFFTDPLGWLEAKFTDWFLGAE